MSPLKLTSPHEHYREELVSLHPRGPDLLELAEADLDRVHDLLDRLGVPGTRSDTCASDRVGELTDIFSRLETSAREVLMVARAFASRRLPVVSRRLGELTVLLGRIEKWRRP